MSSYEIHERKIVVHQAMDLINPSEIHYKLFHIFVLQILPTLNIFTIQFSFESAKEAKSTFVIYQEFIEKYSDLIPRDITVEIVIDDNNITVWLILHYLTLRLQKIKREIDVIKPHYAPDEFWFMIKSYQDLMDFHTKKWLSYLMGWVETTFTFPNGDFSRLSIEYLDKYKSDEIIQMIGMLKGYHDSVFSSEKELIEKYFHSKGIEVKESKMDSQVSRYIVYAYVIFYNLFLDKKLYFGLTSHNIIIWNTIYTEMLLFDDLALWTIIKKWYSLMIINNNFALDSFSGKFMDHEEILIIKQKVKQTYEELIEWKINENSGLDLVIGYIRDMFEIWKNRRPSFVIQTNWMQVSTVKISVEEANPKEFYNTQQALWTQDFRQKKRWKSNIRIIEKTFSLDDLKNQKIN